MEIEAKVARVLSASSVALNVGIVHGVELGDSVNVWRSVEIKDPDTGDLLGSVRLLRMTLDITTVQERLSVAHVHIPSVSSVISLSMFPSQDKFISGEGVKDSQYVPIAAGDPVTVFVNDDSDSDEGH